MQNRTWLGLLPVVLVLVLGMMIMQGCSDDPTDPDPGPTPESVDLPASTSVHILMNNFMTVNEDRYIEGYEHILHDDFRIMIMQETFDAWEGSGYPLDQMYFDRDSCISITGNMFSEQDGINEAGIAQPPIIGISVDVLELQGAWEPVDNTVNYFGDFENVYTASYDLLIYFMTTGNHRFEVDQILNFYAVDVSGGNQNEWELLGISAAYGKPQSGTSRTSYDSVLSIYR